MLFGVMISYILVPLAMMFILLFVMSCLTWLILRWKRRHFEKLYQRIRVSSLRWPIFGHLHVFLCSEEERMKRIQYLGREAMDSGGITGFWLMNKLYLMVADSEIADILMKTCLQKDDVVNCFHLATGDGSIFSSVEKWRPRRKYLAPTFGMKNLNYYVKTFSKLSDDILEKIETEKSTGSDTIQMGKVFLEYTMNAIFGSLGIEVKAQVGTEHPFLLALKEVMTAAVNRIFNPWLYNDFIYKLTPQYQKLNRYRPIVFGMFHEAIKVKRKEIKEYHDTSITDHTQLFLGGNRACRGCIVYDLQKFNNLTESNSDNPVSIGLKTFISLMIESPANVSDAVIREECVVMVAAASDTSAVSLGYVTLMLARHPEQQAIIYDELKAVISDINRPISPEDLPHLKHLDAFIRETLRLYPPVPLIVRKTEKNIKLPSGLTLVPGCGIFINIWAINRNPLYWGADAERFRPSRFQDPRPRHPAAFVSFSHGPRNCLGYQYAMMSIKTVTASLLGRYRVEAPTEDLRHQSLRVKYDLMMRHLDNYTVKFVPR